MTTTVTHHTSIRRRARRPGTGIKEKFYRIEVRPKEQAADVKIEDTELGGHVERVLMKGSDGVWRTATWLVAKEDAHVENGELIVDDPEARPVLRRIQGAITHKEGDIFRAKPRAA